MATFFILLITQLPLFFDGFNTWLEYRQKLKIEQQKDKEEYEELIRREDSINLATQRYIDSLRATMTQLPILEIEEKKFTGVDNNNFKAEYIIYLIRNFNWRLGEVTVVEEDGYKLEICDYIGTSGINGRINHDNLKAIICFGNTSYEEDLNIPANLRLSKEEDRAQKRAIKLANCVNSQMKTFTPIHILNLGKHIIEDEDSEWQRQIIIIGLIKKDLEVLEEEALYNGLVKEYLNNNIEFNIMNYSKVGYTTNSLEMKRFFN